MHTATLRIHMDAPIGTISPRIYGHFAEHLGRCCYDGLWANGQLRQDVVAALKPLPVSLLRWPGGCYADHYHWRDGLGEPTRRPHRLGMSCGRTVEDDNRIGTHEFMELCHQLGAEPYLAGNMATGSPQELCDWIEYCNSTFATDLTRERAANGHAAPFQVKLWGIGNESWGCGGNYSAATYAQLYRVYATMVQHVDPQIELVLVGFDDVWNGEVLKALQSTPKLVNHLSIHHYWFQGGHDTDFTEAQYYALLAEAASSEAFIARTAQLIRDIFGDAQQVGVALDEWGAWHPQSQAWSEALRPHQAFEQAGTLRDALAAGVALEGFHRQCAVLSLANLAQIVNVIHAPVMTEGQRMWVTPTYHALRLHAPHSGATALPVTLSPGFSLPDGSLAVSGTASIKAGQLAITVINRHVDQAAMVTVPLAGDVRTVSGQLLTGESPRSFNTPEQPDVVGLQPLPVHVDGATVRFELPAHSMATVLIA